MIPKYLATLAIAVVLVTLGASSLQFATRAQVLSGSVVDEKLQIEFTIEADGSHTYEITPPFAQYLEEHISFHTEGPAHVVSSEVEVTPKDVSWTENRETITSTGAAMKVQYKWDTPANSANGARGTVYLDFPEVPGLEGKTVSFHSGGYQKDDAGRNMVREITTYRNTFLLAFARFRFALAAGLPFGILLHTIFWIFVLRGEKRSRIAAFPPEGAALPRTFHPYPIAEWGAFLLLFGIGTALASMMAGISVYEGFMSSTFGSIVYIVLAIAAAIGLTAAYFRGRSLLTVRVESYGISYARGRGDLQWINVTWGEILTLMERSRTYRGSTTYWLEIEFQDKRKKLKIEQSIVGYAELRGLLGSGFHR